MALEIKTESKSKNYKKRTQTVSIICNTILKSQNLGENVLGYLPDLLDLQTTSRISIQNFNYRNGKSFFIKGIVSTAMLQELEQITQRLKFLNAQYPNKDYNFCEEGNTEYFNYITKYTTNTECFNDDNIPLLVNVVSRCEVTDVQIRDKPIKRAIALLEDTIISIKYYNTFPIPSTIREAMNLQICFILDNENYKEYYDIENFIEKVRKFHIAFNNPNPQVPTFEDKHSKLRYDMILEELDELRDAHPEENQVEIADALTDILYLLCGSFVAHGLTFDNKKFDINNEMLLNGDFGYKFYMQENYDSFLSLLNEYKTCALNANAEGVKTSLIKMLKFVYCWFNSYGFEHHITAFFNEVQRSNMSKLDENGQAIYNEKGKIMKSDLYTKPNLREILYPTKEKNEEVLYEIIKKND